MRWADLAPIPLIDCSALTLLLTIAVLMSSGVMDDSIILAKKDVVYTGENRIFDDPHFKRLKNNAERKKVIAGKAVKYINDFDTIFLDGSTTTHYLAKLLTGETDKKNLTVVTYSPIKI